VRNNESSEGSGLVDRGIAAQCYGA
jgi:hypothetical protein